MNRIFNEIAFRSLFLSAYFMSLFPMKMLYAFSSSAYLIMYFVFPYRKLVVIQNISRSFPDKKYDEIKLIIKQFYRSFTDSFAEILKMLSISHQDLEKKVTLVNFEWVQNQLLQGKNVIACLGHCGNWEMLNMLPQSVGFDIYAVYKPLRNKVLNRITYKIRSRFGMKLVPSKSVAKQVLSKKNSPALYLMLADQCPGRASEKYTFSFLNQQTSMLIGTEKLARASNSPVIFIQIKRLSRGHYQIECIPICIDSRDMQDAEITRDYVRLLQNNIHEEPSGWLWSHKRWKR